MAKAIGFMKFLSEFFFDNKERLIGFIAGFLLCYLIMKIGFVVGVLLPVCIWYFGMTGRGRDKVKGLLSKSKVKSESK